MGQIGPGGGASVTNFGPGADGKTWAGKAPAGAAVSVLRNGTQVGTATADGTGLWTYTFASAPLTTDAVRAAASVESAAVNGLWLPLIALGQYTPYRKGMWSAYLSPFNSGALHAGDTFTVSATVDPNVFPLAYAVSWSFPAGYSCPAGVWGYLKKDFGDYQNTSPLVPIPASKVSQISGLVLTHDQTITGASEGFDVMVDMFLTSGVGSGTTRLCEVMIFLHTPSTSVSYRLSGTAIPSLTDGNGRVWAIGRVVAQDGTPIFLLMPADQSDVLSGTVDIKAMFDWLVSKGALTGNEYFNGLAIGVEPTIGSGTWTDTATYINYTQAGVGALAAPSNIVAPVIKGTAQKGLVGRVTGGQWAGNPAPKLTYQKKRNGSPVAGALLPAIAYEQADVGQSITWDVTATNGVGSPVTVTTAPVVPAGVASGTVILDEPFDSTNGWVVYGNMSISGGKLRFNSFGAFDGPRKVIDLDAGAQYDVTIYIDSIAAGGLGPFFSGGGTSSSLTYRTAAGTYTDRLTVNTGNTQIQILTNATTTAVIDRIKITKV